MARPILKLTHRLELPPYIINFAVHTASTQQLLTLSDLIDEVLNPTSLLNDAEPAHTSVRRTGPENSGRAGRL